MKTAIITGAFGNLGKAVVKKFLAEGYQVIGTVSPGSNKDVISHKNLEIVAVDLTNEADSIAFVRKAAEKYHEISAALLLAGGFKMGKIKESGKEALLEMINLNFMTAYFTAREAFEHMIQQKHGKIVFVGARPVLEPDLGKNALPYTLSKSMLFQLSELLNAEGHNKNIVSGLIVPDIIDSPENRQSMPGADFSQWATPEEVAELIMFACSDKAKILKEPVFKV